MVGSFIIIIISSIICLTNLDQKAGNGSFCYIFWGYYRGNAQSYLFFLIITEFRFKLKAKFKFSSFPIATCS